MCYTIHTSKQRIGRYQTRRRRLKTTLNKIRKNKPCTEGWEKLLRSLGKTKADDEPVSIIQVLDSNGLDDALWCLRAVSGHDREIRLFAVWCARQVEHLMKDQRSMDALNVAERFANGDASQVELDAAESAAWAAALALRRPSRNAAEAAAESAAESAAWAAARAAARAAWAAAASAARDAAKATQEKELRRICAAIEAMEKESV
jgi:hypothetical protein